MKTPRKGSTDSAPDSSPARGKRRDESAHPGKKKATASDAGQRPNTQIQGLPPNENIRKRADEVYGDTEIPERKPGT
jgi:hypothetical protein